MKMKTVVLKGRSGPEGEKAGDNLPESGRILPAGGLAGRVMLVGVGQAVRQSDGLDAGELELLELILQVRTGLR